MRPLYRSAWDDPLRREEPDARERVSRKVAALEAKGATRAQALEAVLGPPGTQARTWYGQ